MAKKKLINKSITYVNFSPYENAGKILDYLSETYATLIVFSFNFHKLGQRQKNSKIIRYKNGKIVSTTSLFQLPIDIPFSLVFFLLPLRSAIIFIQITWHSILLKREIGEVNYYFTVNAFTAWIGIILRRFELVEKTIFWVWDYYPPLHGNKIVNLMRWLYWQYDKAAIASDRLVFLNQRLIDLRKDIGVLSHSSEYPVVPIGTDPKKNVRKLKKNLIIGILGVQKKSQGLDLIFDNANKIQEKFPGVRLEIIGSGPDEKYFREKAKKSNFPTKFYGFLPKNAQVDLVLAKWDIGIALYKPEEGNVIYYTDPSKIKYYFSFGIPVITTKMFRFSDEIQASNAGVVVNYDENEFIDALKKISSNYEIFSNSAKKLSHKYYFRKIYPNMFKV